MINFTDMTGLASSAVAIIAVAVRLPGMARLQRPHLILLVCAIVMAVLIPFGGLPIAAYVRGWMGDLSIPSLLLLTWLILKRLLNWPPSDVKTRTALLLLIALAAVGLYPTALGVGYFDPYRLGYGNPWLVGGLLLIALIACFRQFPVVALTIALAALAWGVGWYESANLWDYLIDPLLAVYAICTLMGQGMQTLRKLRRD